MTTYAEVKQIKRLLWEGHLTQTAIARRYKTSQPIVSRIMNGATWESVPWPDGTKSTMSSDRCDVISTSRHRHASLASRSRKAAHAGSRAAAYLRLPRIRLVAELIREPTLRWSAISTLDPAHPLIVVNDAKSRPSVILVLSALPIGEWGIAPTYELIERVRKELEK